MTTRQVQIGFLVILLCVMAVAGHLGYRLGKRTADNWYRDNPGTFTCLSTTGAIWWNIDNKIKQPHREISIEEYDAWLTQHSDGTRGGTAPGKSCISKQDEDLSDVVCMDGETVRIRPQEPSVKP